MRKRVLSILQSNIMAWYSPLLLKATLLLHEALSCACLKLLCCAARCSYLILYTDLNVVRKSSQQQHFANMPRTSVHQPFLFETAPNAAQMSHIAKQVDFDLLSYPLRVPRVVDLSTSAMHRYSCIGWRLFTIGNRLVGCLVHRPTVWPSSTKTVDSTIVPWSLNLMLGAT